MGEPEPASTTVRVRPETVERLVELIDGDHRTMDAVITGLLDAKPAGRRTAGANA